jgi:hypothetical protein
MLDDESKLLLFIKIYNILYTSFKLKVDMARIFLTFGFTLLFGSCSILTRNDIDWEHARLACEDVGISPGSSIFDQCVSNLYNSLWQEQNVGER